MVKEDKATWKSNYFIRLGELLENYPKLFIVGVDNVGSKQMQEIRIAMRGRAEILMGKNTMIRKAIRGHIANNPALEKLLPHIVGNVGFVFTRDDLSEVREMLLANRKEAPARAGAIAPVDVKLPAQNTGMGPEKTSFFQALNIPTKISRGTIEILNDVKLITAGDKVGASEATLLQMLSIKPFSYGFVIKKVYDSGSLFEPAILDITTEDLRSKFLQGVRNIAALGLALNIPNAASAPHSLAKGLKNLLAIAAASDVTFKEAEQMKEILADPTKLAALQATSAAPANASAPAEAKAEAKKVESEEDSDEDMGLGLFD